MKLLSPFLTLLRISNEDAAVIHGPLWPPAEGARDLEIPPPPDGVAAMPVPGLPGIVLERTAHPRLVRLAGDDRLLRSEPGQTKAFLAPRLAGDFQFVLLGEAEAEALTVLAAHAWTIGEGDQAAEVTVLPGAPYMLDLGLFTFDLRNGLPRVEAAGTRVVLEGGSASVTLTRRGPARDEIVLRAPPPSNGSHEAASPTEFASEGDRALHLPGAEEVVAMPITMCCADSDWLFRKPRETFELPVGRAHYAPLLRRQSDKFVMLARHVEGMVFDQSGVFSEAGYLQHIGSGGIRHLPLPAGMRQEGERLFVDRAVLAACPVLEGPHVVFYGGHLANYAHWLVDALLPLHAMLPYLPQGAKLLLPGTLRQFAGSGGQVCDHYESLRTLGFSTLPFTEIDAPYCRLRDVIWHNASVSNISARAVRAFRDAVLSSRPPDDGPGRNVYIVRRRTRRVANEEELQHFLRRRNFETVCMEDLSFSEQIDLFASARVIVSPHGAELASLLFCRPGTKLLELAPDIEFKPYYALLTNKLGLPHGVLPCRTTDGGFFGDMTVDMAKFESLFRMMRQRM